jgi:hypothetical protein
LWNNKNDKVWNGTQEAGRRLGYKALQALAWVGLGAAAEIDLGTVETNHHLEETSFGLV